ncbi:ABC transporter permease, partial [Enterococcus cecorum]|uniref:ABC transporter permease n=1 Tax=Enterococcus cecorum TaxID=44008 RepID=UPI001FAC6552
CQNGDMLSLQDSHGTIYTIQVAAVAKYYIGNFIYMTKNYAEDIFGSNYQKNTLLIQVTKMSKSQEEKFSKKVLATNKVTNLTLMTGQIRLQKKMTDNLDIIVLIFVVLSGMLALVVLYNLTNINISERLRELSTIKVLGFYNKEVTMYIVRENIIFTILGIILGFGVGYLLTGFILYQVSFNPVIFPIKIHASAYLLASSMTILFTIIVMVITHFRLKHIHMIDALKSNE